MERMFLITTSNRVRVESRILQVLDHHAVPVESFSSMRLGDEARVTFMAKLDEDVARRTCDMLRRLQDVQSIDCFAYQEGFCRTLAMFRILCDQESRLPLAAGHLFHGRAGGGSASRLGCVSDHRQLAGYRGTSRQPATLWLGRGDFRCFDRRAKPRQPRIAPRRRSANDRRAQDSQQLHQSCIGECLPGVCLNAPSAIRRTGPQAYRSSRSAFSR